MAEGTELTGGIVNMPAVVIDHLYDAYVGQAYTFSFTVDAPFGVKGDMTATLAGEALTVTEEEGVYTVTIPVEKVTGGKLTVTISGVDNQGKAITRTVEIPVKDEPVLSDPTPMRGAQTGSDKRPAISVALANAGTEPTITMTVNGKTVDAVYEGGRVTYTPAADLTDGRTEVVVTAKRTDGKEASFNWFFTVGKTQYQLYFGQLHSHTQYSDGSGTLTSALDYIKSIPASANVQFVAFTDHSNYFDSKTNANVEGALYDTSLVKDSDANHSWSTYKSTIDAFNAENAGSMVALGGFEMTWSGGPGHINTFNTPGVVSRNNTTLNNKTDDAGMKAYYALLSQAEGVDSISQFNHPGTTFGNFSDFSYWDPSLTAVCIWWRWVTARARSAPAATIPAMSSTSWRWIRAGTWLPPTTRTTTRAAGAMPTTPVTLSSPTTSPKRASTRPSEPCGCTPPRIRTWSWATPSTVR